MSSQIEQDEFIEGLREDGVLDQLNASLGRAEAPEEETAEEPAEVEAPAEETVDEEPEATPEEEEPEEDLAAEEAVQPEGEWEIELTPETEELLSKYDGDLNKALRAAAEAQSLIGRQGNELGDVRRELQEMRDAIAMQQQMQLSQPQPYQTYLPDPEEADEEDMAAAYASLAAEAVQRQDPGTLQQAVEAWGELQPFAASQFLSRLQQQAYQNQLAAIQNQDRGNELADRVGELKEKYPDISERVNELGEEAARSPTLSRFLQEGTEAERVDALEELYLRVAKRQTSETSQQALRRVAVKTSEEARKARQQAQVAASGRGPVSAPETGASKIALGRTGRFVDLDRVDEILKSDRI